MNRPCSNMVTSSSGSIRFALAAALGPAADPPMMISFSFLDIFISLILQPKALAYDKKYPLSDFKFIRNSAI